MVIHEGRMSWVQQKWSDRPSSSSSNRSNYAKQSLHLLFSVFGRHFKSHVSKEVCFFILGLTRYFFNRCVILASHLISQFLDFFPKKRSDNISILFIQVTELPSSFTSLQFKLSALLHAALTVPTLHPREGAGIYVTGS